MQNVLVCNIDTSFQHTLTGKKYVNNRVLNAYSKCFKQHANRRRNYTKIQPGYYLDRYVKVKEISSNISKRLQIYQDNVKYTKNDFKYTKMTSSMPK